MKTSTFIRSSVRYGLLAAVLSLSNWSNAQWVSFNDHIDGPGTHPNTTRYTIPVNTGTPSGFLKDINAGTNLPVTLTITTNGTVAITTGTAAGLPGVGTPAYNVFNGFVDFGTTNRTGNAVQTPLNSSVVYTFTGLDVTKQYKFQGSAVRAGPATGNYTNRWEVYGIVGAASFVNVPTPGCVTAAQEPGSIAANEVVFNAGTNTNAPPAAGEMAEWDNIVPGAGGTFSVTSTRYAGPLPAPNSSTLNGPTYSYALSGIRLEEVNLVPACVAITQPPTNQTASQCSSVTMHVTATGNPAPTYQWFKGSTAIGGATTANYNLPSVQSTDAGTYHVTVSNTAPGCNNVSATNTLTVTPYALVSAVGTTNPAQVLLTFSSSVDPASFDTFSFSVFQRGNPGNTLGVTDATNNTSTTILLTTSPDRADSVNYDVSISAGTVSGTCAGSQVATGPYHITSQLIVVGIGDAAWQYNQSGTDPGPTWIQTGFNDAVAPWQTGTNVFDGKNTGPRAMSGGSPVNTVLVLTNAGPFGSNDIPTYNFRKHFNFPGQTNGASLTARVIIDDAAIFYINGKEAARVGGLTNGVAIPFAEYGGANTNGNGWGSRTVGTPTDITDTITLPLTNVVAGGDNVLAVELKQERNTSSDITMGVELIAAIPTLSAPLPRLTFTRDPGFDDGDLTWNSGTLQYNTNLSRGSGWHNVPGLAPGATTYHLEFTPGPSLKTNMMFFRLTNAPSVF